MVTRRQKLFAAGIVLAIGFGLAWPLRRSTPLLCASLSITSPTVEAQTLPQPVVLDMQTTPGSPGASAASMASGTPAPSNGIRDPFAAAQPTSAENVAPRSTYSTISNAAGPPLAARDEAESDTRIHVVHQGDSLDRLANRYLGDAARALEIFDLNREVLKNPHLLPIGAELRLPPAMPSDGSER